MLEIPLACVCGGLVGWSAHGPQAMLLPAALALLLWCSLALRCAAQQPARSVLIMALATASQYLVAEHWVRLAVPGTLEQAWLWRGVFWWLVAGFEALLSALCWAALLVLMRLASAGAVTGRWALAWAAAWTLAWWTADVWRSAGWWGNGYASLALGLLDLPGWRPWLALIGAPGLSALAMACVALAATALLRWAPWHTGARQAAGPWLAVALAAPAGVAVVGALVLGPASSWTTPRTTNLPVTAVQESHDKRAGWTAQDRDRGMQSLLRAVANTPAGGLVVAPETYFMDAVPPADAPGWQALPQATQRRGVHVMVGMPMAGRDEHGPMMMNAVVHVAPERVAFYAKERLVPGAEYVPWPALTQPILDRVLLMKLIGQSPSPPALREPLYVAGHLIGASVCHELAFAETMARRGVNSHLLLNVADDNWIPSPDYLQLMQRLARVRAAEAGKPLLRVSNGAPTWLVHGDGELASAGLMTADQAEQVRLTLVPREGSTPYQRSAAWQSALPPALCLIAFGLALGQRRRRRHDQPDGQHKLVAAREGSTP